ncbi:acetate uptake transporter [Streptococcus sp. E24BD]|uniref:acetate uptake transporter n=1 Tax=Streptococcus sp. E24BD TaxID=3278715 RepID=UPI00359CFB99
MSETKIIKIANADPSALGLFGLVIVTLVASSQKLGLTTGTSLVVPWAIFLGAFAQLFACIHDAKRQNLFGTTAFGAYALFWFGVAMSWMTQNGVFGAKMAELSDVKQLSFAFLGYLIFTLVMTLAATETNKTLLTIFVLIDLLFIGLTLSTLGIAEHAMHSLAAYSELAISAVSFYGFVVNILNGQFGYQFLPFGKPLGIFKK